MSNPRQIAAMFEGAPLALSHEHAAQLLTLEMPEASEQTAAVNLDRGERFAINRSVAIVPVQGLITPNSWMLERYLGWTTCHGLEATMAELETSEDVAAVVLICDSPGGIAMSVSGAAAAVRKAAKTKPVHALIHPLCASAAYWIAAQATDITLTPGSWMGSVGAMSTSAAYVQPGMTSGAQVHITTSSHAAAKRPDPSSDKGRAEILRMVDALEADFLRDVSAGRGVSVDELTARLSVSDDPADGGAVFWGQDAIDRGLVDHLKTQVEFWDRIGASYAPKPVKKSARGALALAEAAQAAAQI